MGDGERLSGTRLQRQLSEFLSGELLHTVGAYRLACEKLEPLIETLGESSVERELREAAEAAEYGNRQLRNHLHRPPRAGLGDPELSRRPPPFEEGDGPELPNESLLRSIADFYGDAEAALITHRDDPGAAERRDAPPIHRLGKVFAFVHDRQRRGKLSGPEWDALVRGRIDRTRSRREEAIALIPGAGRPHQFGPNSPLSGRREERLARIRTGHASGENQLLRTIVQALSEAHMWMHHAEHVRAQRFGAMLTTIPKTHAEAQLVLRHSLVLNTFVFVAARATPWIFAEDESEREHVVANYVACCDTLAPTYCMWTATQFSMLALHRRAFTWWTTGEHDRAYRDFYKLTRLLRSLRVPAEKRALRVPGTKTFIGGVSAMSEHHIGRIYRGQHAHRMALRYFERASDRLAEWHDHGEVGLIVKNSHWHINLLINKGKAHYELGQVKRSIYYYALAWRAFLLLVDSETHATANVEIVDGFVKWLKGCVDDPELNRKELRARIEPLVDQFRTLRNPANLRLLAADIVMRMGHLLFILKLPPGRGEDGENDPMAVDHTLAWKCIEQASRLDPASTLTAADRLKIEHEAEDLEGADDLEEVGLAEQWPSGSGRFEEAARITEYTLQCWLAATAPEGGEDTLDREERIARQLLVSFLAHTDSSNVKLAQVYRYLMREGRKRVRGTAPGTHVLDFVCMRRYSSFFPFLPRPSAFRAAGGGYFVQAHDPDEAIKPFGIAIDPGPDFIENLYRCGHSLADIQMVVLTHDHADHIASLDALLALLANRKGLGDETFDGEANERLAIVGNESVHRRYTFFNDPEHPKKKTADGQPAPRNDAVRVLTFEQIADITRLNGPPRKARIEHHGILLEPPTLRIEPVQTWGHTDANGYVSQGFMLRFGPAGRRSSILFTGDTGAPPDFGTGSEDPAGNLLAEGSNLRAAIEEADVVVAHLSSVPLRELRLLAGLRHDVGGSAQGVISEYLDLWGKAAAEAARSAGDEAEREGVEQTQFLLNQIQFGFRSRPRDRDRDFSVSPFRDIEGIRKQSAQHLYLTGLIKVAELMARGDRLGTQVLLVGELREELGTFRTQIAGRLNEVFFADARADRSALTADIGLRLRLSRAPGGGKPIRVLCTTCDLDNDLIPSERFHLPHEIHELCVKGEDEGVFYNCSLHEPRRQGDRLWLEAVERFDVFGE